MMIKYFITLWITLTSICSTQSLLGRGDPIPIPGSSLCKDWEWSQLPIGAFPPIGIPFEILLVGKDINKTVSQTEDTCQTACLERRVETEDGSSVECRFYAGIYLSRPSRDLIACYLIGYNNNWFHNDGTVWKMLIYAKPRYCMPNDGCTYPGEYIADSKNRCMFHQCAYGTNHELVAKKFLCPFATTVREKFLTSRLEDPYFTQPCSRLGFNCKRQIPVFAP